MPERRWNPWRWVLLEGSRHVVAVLVVAGVFAALLALSSVGVVDLRDPATARGVGGGLIPGLFTFISIVLAINQLVLTQEFGSADELQRRVRELRSFRRDVEEVAQSGPSPVLPTAFLELVVRAVAGAATRLQTTGADADDHSDRFAAAGRGDTGASSRPFDEYAASVRERARTAADDLNDRRAGRIDAVLSVLEYPEAAQLHEARRLRTEHGVALSEDRRAALDDLVEALALFSVARTHFRTTYTQRVLARLSRRLLYVGVPAMIASFVLVGLATAGPWWLERGRAVVVAALIAVALSPLAVLLAYILRIATVSERTIGVGPFVSRPGEREE